MSGRIDSSPVWFKLGRPFKALANFSKEILLLSLFWSGPWALLAVTMLSAAIVSVVCAIGKRLKRDERMYHRMGLDAAALFLKYVFRLWHGLEFRGFDNIPSKGGALLVWFHGPLPTDYLALVAEIQFHYGKNVKSIMDRTLKEKVPYSQVFIEKLGCVCEGRDYCSNLLKQGELVGVSPGGSRECLFGEKYEVNWGRRTGFASVALEANVPIIPVFTENIREAYSTMSSLYFLLRYVYETTRLTFFPIWGGYPVKLITHIGRPIYPTDTDTAESLRDKAKRAIEDLMDRHQGPPSVTRAILQRVRSKPEQKSDTLLA